MIVTFAQPWTISGDGNTIELPTGDKKTYLEMRQDACKHIIDDMIFISRASEGAISIAWLQNQPIYIRMRCKEAMVKELKDREAKLNLRAADKKG